MAWWHCVFQAVFLGAPDHPQHCVLLVLFVGGSNNRNNMCSCLNLLDGLRTLCVPSHVCSRAWWLCIHSLIDGRVNDPCVLPFTCGLTKWYCVFLSVFVGGRPTINTVCSSTPFFYSYTCGMAWWHCIFLAKFVEGPYDPPMCVFLSTLVGWSDDAVFLPTLVGGPDYTICS